MLSDLRSIVPEEEQKHLRKTHTLSDAVKAAIYGGNLASARMAQQFHYDLKVYDLWEALLYVQGYEAEGLYEEGTAMKAYLASKLLPDETEEEQHNLQ